MTVKKLIMGNWKMHKTPEEAARAASLLAENFKEPLLNGEIAIAPAFPALTECSRALSNSPVLLAAQDVNPEKEGAYTGEVSASMLKASSCSFVIAGHSERRQYYKEDNKLINSKLKAIINTDMRAVLCIGESEEERNGDLTFKVLDKQVKEGVKGLPVTDASFLVLAYEPVWAIGTGKTAETEQIEEVHAFLRKILAESFEKSLANNIRILYGGSVKTSNVKDLMKLENVDGALVGGASLDPLVFSDLIRKGLYL